jgi:hypothetical protein
MVLEDRSGGGTMVTGVDEESGDEKMQLDEEVGPSTGRKETEFQCECHRQKRTRAALKGDEDGEEEQSRKMHIGKL